MSSAAAVDDETVGGTSPVVFTVLSQFFLFMLIGGMAGTTDLSGFRAQLTNVRGIATGLVCQFFLLPFLGFCAVFAFRLEPTFGIMLLLTTTSPGGGFSGWWCSLGNADIALSVAMTTVSTLVSIVMLPVNVIIYVQLVFGTSVVLDWTGIAVSIAVVIGAVLVGVTLGTYMPERKTFFNHMGTVGGIANIVLGLVASSGGSTPLWGYPALWYVAVGAPCVAGLFISFGIARALRCSWPEAVSICIECCYQNTGLAITVALTIFPPQEAARATAVPIFYGGIEILLIAMFTLFAWQMGWTYAPRTDSFLKCVTGNYQPLTANDLRRRESAATAVMERAHSPVADEDAPEEASLEVAGTSPKVSSSASSRFMASVGLSFGSRQRIQQAPHSAHGAANSSMSGSGSDARMLTNVVPRVT